jgi:hypothetical protein
MNLDLSLKNKMHPLSTWQSFPTAPDRRALLNENSAKVRLAMGFFFLPLANIRGRTFQSPFADGGILHVSLKLLCGHYGLPIAS